MPAKKTAAAKAPAKAPVTSTYQVNEGVRVSEGVRVTIPRPDISGMEIPPSSSGPSSSSMEDLPPVDLQYVCVCV